MNVNVLTSGYWPSYPHLEAKLPDELTRYQTVFKVATGNWPPACRMHECPNSYIVVLACSIMLSADVIKPKTIIAHSRALGLMTPALNMMSCYMQAQLYSCLRIH